jgi:putative ABC transport system ATP-binding protein
MGKRLTRRPETERSAMRAADIGILLQSRNLFEHLSVDDNMRLQMRLARKFDKRRLGKLIDMVGLHDRRHARPAQLSGGEAARAALAVALSTEPKVLLADEPTGEVDVETEKHILQLLEARRSDGSATLIATHSDALAAHADRIVRLLDGRVVHA